MGKKLFYFLSLFILVIVISYFTHLGILNALFPTKNLSIVNISYIFNTAFTLLFTALIIVLSKKYKDQLGFIFMAGSLIKIGTFLALSKLNNLEMSKNVFLDFFIAYVICLIFEVYYVSKILNTIK